MAGKGSADTRVSDRKAYRDNYDDIFRKGGSCPNKKAFETEKIKVIKKADK